MRMKLRRSILPAACTCTALVLCGCTGTPERSAAPTATRATTVTPAPAAGATAQCRDQQPDVASLAPGSISTDRKTWGSDSTMAKIRARGHLIVGTSGDARLWGARNPTSGAIEGFDVDVAARVAEALGVEPRKTVYKVLTIAQRVPALQNKQVDLVAERMTITCDRWQGSAAAPQAYVNMSTAYYVSGARFLVRSDSRARNLADLKNQTVCGVKASTSLDALNRADTTNSVKKLVVPEPGRCLVNFQEGEADAVVGDDTTLAGLASQDRYARIIGDRLNSSPVGLALHPDATDLTRFVNVVLQQMRTDGSLTRLYNTWMKPTVKDSAPSVPQPRYGRDIPALKRQS
jgi:polar amino acid transport system substrate-binding protein